MSTLRTKDPDLISLVVIPKKHSNCASYSQLESVLDKQETTLSVLTLLLVLMTTASQQEEGVGERGGSNVLCHCLLPQPAPVHEQKKTHFYIKINSNIVHLQSQLCYPLSALFPPTLKQNQHFHIHRACKGFSISSANRAPH